MLYRLLRNNKESGPFSALQLKDMGLKPYDLLWAEGRGAAWQYASELTELKDFAPVVEEQPFERFTKRKEGLQAAAQPAAVATKKVKPRYRISNGQLIMVESGTMEVGTNGVIKETVPARSTVNPIEMAPAENTTADQSDWQNVYPQWQPQQQPKKETKAVEQPVEVETKYSESLDDLKKRYAEKVLGDKKGSSSSSSLSSASVKQNITAILALVVLAAGGYIGYTLKKKNDSSITSGQPVVERADIAGNNTNDGQSTDSNDPSGNNNSDAANGGNTKPANAQPGNNKGIVTTASNANTQNSGKSTVPSVGKENDGKTTIVTPQRKIPEVIAKTTTTQLDQVTAKPAAAVAKTTAKPANSTTAKTDVASAKSNTTSAAILPPMPVAKDAGKQIGDYVSVRKVGGSGAGVQNIKLMVSNVSDFPIDLAVVDIQYFDSKGKYQKGETMYVKDINGGNNVEVRVPDSERASSIKYKVSMVQADQKTLYMVAD